MEANRMSFEKLNSFILPLCTKHTLQPGRPNARFGHVKIPMSHADSQNVLDMINQSLIKGGHDGDLLIVSSDLEIGLARGLRGPRHLLPMSFSEALDQLRDNRVAAGDESNFKWKSPSGQSQGVLPVDVFVVFHIDPTLPADCALALIALVEWALGVSSERESNIRVLTICSDSECDFLSNLVGLRAPELFVSHLDLTDDNDDTLKGVDIQTLLSSQDTIEVIRNSLIERPDISNIVVSFRSPALWTSMANLVDEYRLEERIVSSVEDLSEIVNIIERREKETIVWLTIDPALPLPALQFRGYDNVYVLPSSRHETAPCWDNRTHQVVYYPRSVSSDERLSQLAWARQDSATVYLLLEEDSIDPEKNHTTTKPFKVPGIRRRRLLENRQIGGFILSVVELSSWGFDVNGVLDCFIRYSLRRNIMKYRLEKQGIIDQDGVALSGNEACALRSLLPLFNYDHRPAFFVALDSDEIARKIKIQLATVVALGLDRLVLLKTEEEIEPGSPQAKAILSWCWGYAKDLAAQGTMWLALALWRGYTFSRVARFGQGSFDDLIKVDPALNNKANDLLKRVSNKLDLLGVRSASDATIDQETMSMDDKAERKLQSHLLKAYVFQLSMGNHPLEGGIPQVSKAPVFWMIARWAETETLVLPSSITSLIVPEDLMADSGEAGFSSISHDIDRATSEFTVLQDWNMIPNSVVAEWLVEYRPGHNVFAALAAPFETVVVNCDEIAMYK
ncbi:hypothetical protein H9Q74_000015 [Fusarium xylarioides]|nr:hypothetical protein H9Q71_000169 [Fusarium xylarioides]KAG5829862.1 hypothetical protein H9Q74_000015 [Fusarium xylarioides]